MQPSPENYDVIYREDNFDVVYKAIIDGQEFGSEDIWSIKTSKACITAQSFLMGNVMVGQVDMTIMKPETEFARMAKIQLFIKLVSRTSGMESGWAQKGEFFIDTRPTDESDDLKTMEIRGYDALRKASQPYPYSTLEWTSASPYAQDVVDEIAMHLGVPVEKGTSAVLSASRDAQHVVGFPAQYTISETLSSIGTMFASNFIISDAGELMLVGLFDLPDETFYLIDERYDNITFGGTRILVGY